jgi:hypothetical protein
MAAARQGFLRLALGLLLLPGATAFALEHSSQDSPGDHGDNVNAALKPSYLFSMRGRHDPFINLYRWVSAGSQSAFNISLLAFKGLITVDGQVTALFVSSNDRALYTLRGSRLYGANDQAVPGVSGRLIGDNQIRLRQGELTLNFSALRAPKRKN